MKETLGVLLAASVLVAGCGGAHESGPPPPTTITFDAGEGELPAPVTDQLQNVIAVEGIRSKIADPKHEQQAKICSGIRIDNLAYLSDSQCDWDLAEVDQIPYCDALGVSIAIPGDKPNGLTIPASKKSGTRVANEVLRAHDESMLIEIAPKKDEKVPDYNHPTHIGVSPHSIDAGTQLYLANFEPTSDGKIRNPDPKFLPEKSPKAGPNTPVIVGAIALNRTPDGLLGVLIEKKKYKGSDETDFRSGDSGGPVWDANGNLVGVEANSSLPQKVIDIEQRLQIDIQGLADDSMVQVAFVQPINPSHIRELQSKKLPPQTC